MKKSTLALALAAALLTVSTAQASEFSGGWLGLKVGQNRSDINGLSSAAAKSANTYGFEGGYNWDVNSFLLGVDGFADFNQKTTHVTGPVPGTANYGSDVYGLDMKLGLPSGNWLPYAKLGYGSARGTGALTGSYAGAHLGLGVEYKFAPHWSVAGEYTNTSGKNNGLKLNNNNFTIGLNYYFSEPYVAPAVVAVAAAVVPKAEAAPAPAPAPQYKTIFTDRPVTIEGTNFDTNSAKLKPTADKKLAEVVDFTVKYPESDLAVTGHTDSTGSDAYNQKLSEKRAASVKAYLVNKGVPAEHIIAKGEGEAKPVASNKTKAGRAENRRVEITSVVREATKVQVSK